MVNLRINAGKYRHVVTFQRLIDVPNEYGELSKSVDSNWEDAFKARVGIFPISGKEVMTTTMEKGEISHKIYMRYQSGVDSTMRILFGDRIFEITSPPINYQEKNWEISLLVRELEQVPQPLPPAPIYANPPTAMNLAITKTAPNQYYLTWELNGETPLDFTRFDIIVNDAFTLVETNPQARGHLITGVSDEPLNNYVYIATITHTQSFYSSALTFP